MDSDDEYINILPSFNKNQAFGVSISTSSSSSSFVSPPTVTIILADLLIPGRGPPTANTAIVIQGKLIAWVGPSSQIPAKWTSATPPPPTVHVPVAMPGLWDTHVHFGAGGKKEAELDLMLGMITQHPATTGARLARGCWEAIQQGYTSMRDLAGFGCELAQAIEDGTIVGPNIYSAGAAISQTAGHGDVFVLPAGDTLLHNGVGNLASGHLGTGACVMVDGVDECRRAARLQIRRGAKCLKVMASGGVLSRDDNPLYAQFSFEEMKTIVEEGRRMGRNVAAHAHGKPGILQAIEAGVSTIEHGTFADDECLQKMKDKGIIYIPTRTIVENLRMGGGKGIPAESWEKAQLCEKYHLKAYQAAISKGVKISLGTDTPPGFNMATELEYAVKAGMTPLQAIEAATAVGPETVGAMAGQTGQIREGFEADVLGVLADPLGDVRVLQEKGNIKWVWKGGRLFKGPGVGPWGPLEFVP